MADNLTIGLIFVMSLNLLMGLSQLATADINPDGPNYFNCSGTMIDNFGDCSTNYINTSDTIDQLPTGESSIEPDTNNIFTDTFRSMKKWFTGLPGVNYLYGMLTAPYNVILSLGLPAGFSFMIGAFWYGITLFLIIAFIWGRN